MEVLIFLAENSAQVFDDFVSFEHKCKTYCLNLALSSH